MRTRYTVASSEGDTGTDYWINDCFSNERFGSYRTYKAAQEVAKNMQKEWVLDLQECKDDLFKSGLLNRSENENIQSKLDAAKGEVWTKNRAWRSK